MVLEKLGSSLYDALRKVIKAPVIDEALVKELIGALNKLGRGRLQYVELLDPQVIEIREVK